ncbi:MAG: hypothetical protein ACOVNR_09880 [Chitinophagaceae bacterium]
MKLTIHFIIIILIGFNTVVLAQDTTLLIENRTTTLPNVMVRSHFDYKKLLQQLKNDTSFYKAFLNLRVLNYTAYNDIQILDKKGKAKASLLSKTTQLRSNGCRTMQIEEETVSGDMYNTNREWNYTTAQLYASLFFTKGKVCGETNIVGNTQFSTEGKKGIEKHKEQLKMLFFNPGRKVPGIPFIGNKLDVYDERAQNYYDYKLDIVEYKGKLAYLFAITPKQKEADKAAANVVIDEMLTWFDIEQLTVVGRTYRMSYHAGVYDFDVQMEVEMTKVGNLTVPKVLRYKGNWDVIFKKREVGIFTATLFNFSKE